MGDSYRPTPLDDAFRAFADPFRRAIICELVDDPDRAFTITALSERVVRRFERATPEQLAQDMQHIHLPRLESLGVIEYDHRSETVRYRDPDAVSRVLDSGFVDC